MNSGKAEQDRQHRAATLLASERRCLSCKAEPPSMPCHFPKHRGMGSGKAGWDPSEWIPLCFVCHEILDRRQQLNDFAKCAEVVRNIKSALERGLWPP